MLRAGIAFRSGKRSNCLKINDKFVGASMWGTSQSQLRRLGKCVGAYCLGPRV